MLSGCKGTIFFWKRRINEELFSENGQFFYRKSDCRLDIHYYFLKGSKIFTFPFSLFP